MTPPYAKLLVLLARELEVVSLGGRVGKAGLEGVVRLLHGCNGMKFQAIFAPYVKGGRWCRGPLSRQSPRNRQGRGRRARS